MIFSISSVYFSISRQIKVFSSRMAWLRIKMNGERPARWGVWIFFFCHQSDHTFFINRKKKSSYWKQWRKHERTKYCVTDSWSPWELAGVTQGLLAQICQAQRPELADPRSWHHFIRIVTAARSRSHCHGFLLISCKPGRSPSEIYDEFFFLCKRFILVLLLLYLT